MSLYAIASGIAETLGGKRARRSRMMVDHLRAAHRKLAETKGDKIPGHVDAAMLVVGVLAGAASVREGGRRARTYADMVGFTLDELADAKAAYEREGKHHLSLYQFIGRALREPDWAAETINRVEVNLDEPRAEAFLKCAEDPDHAVLVFMPIGREIDQYEDGITIKATLQGAKLAAIARHLADKWPHLGAGHA